MTPKQQKILQFLHGNGEMTKKQAVELIGDYYCNNSKHVGDVLTRMVKAGLIKRVKTGTYTIANGYKKSPHIINQVDLFGAKS